MDLTGLPVLKASIIELQELIHEQATKLERTKTEEEFERIAAMLDVLWELNQERAWRYRGNSDPTAGDY